MSILFSSEGESDFEGYKLKVYRLEEEVNKLKRELADTKQLLEGANITFDKIAKLVGDRGQYRDLVEAVEIKLSELNYAKSNVR